MEAKDRLLIMALRLALLLVSLYFAWIQCWVGSMGFAIASSLLVIYDVQETRAQRRKELEEDD